MLLSPLLKPPPHLLLLTRLFSILPQTLPDPVSNPVRWTQTPNNPDAALHLLHPLNIPHPLNISGIIHSLCDSRRFAEAHLRFSLSIASDFAPNNRTCDVLISRLIDAKTPFETRRIVIQLRAAESMFEMSLVNWNRLIDGFCRIGELVLGEMMKRGVELGRVLGTVLVGGCVRVGDSGSAEKVFDEMAERGVGSNLMTYSVFLGGVVRDRESGRWREVLDEVEGMVDEVFRIAEEMPKVKGVDEGFAYAEMIDSFCRVGRHHGASRIVYIMRQKRGMRPSLVSFNSIVHGLNTDGGCMRAYQLCEEGIEFGYVPSEMRCVPDVITCNTILKACCEAERFEEAMKILNDMIGKFCEPDLVSFTTVIFAFLKEGKAEAALNLLHKTMAERRLRPGVVTYNAVIRGLFSLGMATEAMDAYTSMASQGVGADCTAYAIILEGLFQTDHVDEAKRFWDDVGLCGAERFEEACSFLYELVDSGVSPNIVSFNILINSACKLGLKREAYQIVGEMRRNGLSPDSITWRECMSVMDEELKDQLWNHPNAEKMGTGKGVILPVLLSMHDERGNLGRALKQLVEGTIHRCEVELSGAELRFLCMIISSSSLLLCIVDAARGCKIFKIYGSPVLSLSPTNWLFILLLVELQSKSNWTELELSFAGLNLTRFEFPGLNIARSTQRSELYKRRLSSDESIGEMKGKSS
ncbi:Pentatricopeptide repeat-containing protein, partial [Drosera capensis]